MEIELQRNPMPAGERSWVKIRVTNCGGTDVTWLHDGCASPGNVGGLSAVAWSMGEDQPGNLGKFKTYALGGHILRAQPVSPASRSCRNVCSAANRWLRGHRHPGDTRARREPPADSLVVWLHGAEPGVAGRRPGECSRSRRPVLAGQRHIPDAAITFEVPAWIEASDAVERLSPAEIVDGALADPGFAACNIQTQDIASGREEIAWYDADRDTWEVGILPWYETAPPRIQGVAVDALTGKILGPLDREWSRDIDGMP